MTCSPFELKDYYFGELGVTERSAVEGHLNGCEACRGELTSLSNTKAILSALTDEEPPRRIAFVSDKVFEPRWYQRLWSSGPQLGFGAAAMMAAAIVMHGYVVRPAPAVSSVAATGTSISKEAADSEVTRRVRLEVARALAESEARQTRSVLEAVNTRLRQAGHRNTQDLMLIRDYVERMDKRNAVVAKQVLYENE